MTLNVNNHVAFCGKNDALQKLAKKKIPAEIVDKSGIEVPREIELAKPSKAEQMETCVRKILLDSKFTEKINDILGK